jgi:hypothetical protein
MRIILVLKCAIAAITMSGVLVASCAGGVVKLSVGQCFDDPLDLSEVTDVGVVACIAPHDNEVVAVVDLEDGMFPGGSTVGAEADSRCRVAFGEYMGVPYDQSPYILGWLAPSAESWAVGDREVICFVFDPSGNKTTGSLRGINT